MPPRIPPLEPPYAEDVEAQLQRWMPPGAEVEPLALFRTLAHHPALFSAMRPVGAQLLGRPSVTPRERELVLLRTCARWEAAYEWGVHVAAFSAAVGLSDEQARATWHGGPADFADEDADLLRLADALRDTGRVADEDLWGRLSGRFTTAQLLELVAVCGFYALISFACNASGVEGESWAASP